MVCVVIQWHKHCKKFRENWSTASKTKMMTTNTHTHTHTHTEYDDFIRLLIFLFRMENGTTNCPLEGKDTRPTKRIFRFHFLYHSAHITHTRFAVPDLLNKLQGSAKRQPRAWISYILQCFCDSAHLAAPYLPLPQCRFCKTTHTTATELRSKELSLYFVKCVTLHKTYISFSLRVMSLFLDDMTSSVSKIIQWVANDELQCI